MSKLRVWHSYLGLLIAPSVLFFSLTGALQLFGLHEAHGAYQPAVIIEKLGKLHKDQVFARSERHEQPPGPQAGTGPEEHAESGEEEGGAAPAQLVLKCFFLLVALGLATSTTLGLWMGLTLIRHKRTGRILLLLGVIVPVALVLL